MRPSIFRPPQRHPGESLRGEREQQYEHDRAGVLAKIKKVPKICSGEQEPIKIAQDLINLCYDAFEARKNYRGGNSFIGYWSISYPR